jgi:hypothetical protein
MTTVTTERRVRIIADSDPLNPRTEYDCHAGRMLCWHDNYNLGDEHSVDSDNWKRELACEADADLEEELDRLENDVYDRLYDRAIDNGHDGFDDCHEYASRFVSKRIDDLIDKAFDAGYVALPLYLYDHSGITMSTGSFGCPWDSGQVGLIVCDQQTIDDEFEGDRDKAEKCLQAEVEFYDQYLTGDVYGFIIEEREVEEGADLDDDEGWDEIDSCWGFYGSDVHANGIVDHIDADLIESAENADIEYR